MYTPALDSKTENGRTQTDRYYLLHLDLAAIWQHRVLLYFIVCCDLKIRYKQA